MNAWAKRGLQAAFFTGGMLALGAGIASANECCPDRPTPPLAASVSIPVHICDNVIGAPGGPYETLCVNETIGTEDLLAGSSIRTEDLLAGSSIRTDDLLAGSSIRTEDLLAGSSIHTDLLFAPVEFAKLPADAVEQFFRGDRGRVNVVAPFDVSGNAMAVAGEAYTASSSSYALHRPDPVHTDGSTGSLSGNVAAPAGATPVQASGNALAAPGGTAAAAGFQSVAAISGGDIGTTGEGSPLSGNVGSAPLGVPLQVNGNAAAWGGTAYSEAIDSATATAGGDAVSNGEPTQGSGNIVAPAVAGPAAIAGNTISWIARAQTAGSQETVATAGGDYGTTGKHSVLSGSVASPAGALPVQALGNGVAWISNSDAAYDDITASTAGGKHSTGGNGGVGAGHVASVPVAGPTQLAGNAVSWIAGASTDSRTDAQTTAGGDSATDGDYSVFGGGIADLPVAPPVQGFGNGAASIDGADAIHENTVAAEAGGDSYTGVDGSVVGGLLASGPLAGPVDVFGYGGSWIGTASGNGTGTSGSAAVAGREIAQLPVSLPLQGMGNGASWLGTGQGSASNQKWSTAGGPPDSDDGGLLSSNVVTAPVAGPVEAFGNAAGWLANVSGAADSQTTSTAGGPVDATGTSGTGSGNVAAAPIALPGQVFGDAVIWIANGDATASGVTTATAGGDVVSDGSDGTLDGNVTAVIAGGDTTTADGLDGLPSLDDVRVLDGVPGLDPLRVDPVPGIEGLRLPAVDEDAGLAAPSIEDAGLDGFGLPAVGRLPTVPELPDLTGLDTLSSLDVVSRPILDGLTSSGRPTVDGLSDAGGGLPGLDGVRLPGGDALPGMGAPTGLPGWDGMPGLDALPGLDTLPGLAGLPGVDALPGLDGGGSLAPGVLPGQDALPGLDALPSVDTVVPPGSGGVPGLGARPSLDGVPDVHTVSGVDTVPSVHVRPRLDGVLDRLPELAAPAGVDATPCSDALSGQDGLPVRDCVTGLDPATPMPMPVPEYGALPMGDLPALGAIGGLDMLRGLASELDGLVDVPTDLPTD